MYRLVRATGRENNTFDSAPTTKEPNPVVAPSLPKTDQTLRNYTQTYRYDAVGNILRVRHVASTERWTRTYAYALNSNRLLSTQTGSNPTTTINYRYDAHGSMLNYQSTPTDLAWDYYDRVHQLDLGGGGTAFYQYGSDRDRSRKRIVRNGSVTEERIYLGGAELYRRWNGTSLLEEIETHHLFVDDQRVLLVEEVVRTDNSQLNVGILDRYQYSNHLGSVGLELNGNAEIISYEEYHPYGTVAYQMVNAVVKTTGKRYRYTGMERDKESGLNYHSARYYLPWLGRWLSTDPIGIGDGVNVYLYANANPNGFLDDKGTQAKINKDSGFKEHKDLYKDYKFNSRDSTAKDYYGYTILLGVQMGGTLAYSLASKNLAHFLSKEGSKKLIDVDRALSKNSDLIAHFSENIGRTVDKSVADYLSLVEDENINLANTFEDTRISKSAYAFKDFVEDESSGGFVDDDYLLAFGEVYTRTKTRLTYTRSEDDPSTIQVTVISKITLVDRYDWEGNAAKDVKIPWTGLSVNDKNFDTLHRAGMAKSFDLEGVSSVYTTQFSIDASGAKVDKRKIKQQLIDKYKKGEKK